jgi:hypothetical protein
MEDKKILSYVGKHTNLEIIDTTGFDTLTPQIVFIKQEASLILPDGFRAPFANPTYLEYKNSPSGRENLSKSGLNPNLIESIMLLWGNTPLVADPEVANTDSIE